MIVIKSGIGTCPECVGHQRVRYHLLQPIVGDPARLDRLWLCPLSHRERHVDLSPERDVG
jgi:hypothetical protein